MRWSGHAGLGAMINPGAAEEMTIGPLAIGASVSWIVQSRLSMMREAHSPARRPSCRLQSVVLLYTLHMLTVSCYCPFVGSPATSHEHPPPQQQQRHLLQSSAAPEALHGEGCVDVRRPGICTADCPAPGIFSAPVLANNCQLDRPHTQATRNKRATLLFDVVSLPRFRAHCSFVLISMFGAAATMSLLLP